MGPLLHLEKTITGSQSGSGMFSTFCTATAKEEGAEQLITVLKAHAVMQIKAEANCQRFTIVPPGGDTPGADKVTVRWVEQWSCAADFETHKTSAHLGEMTAKLAELGVGGLDGVVVQDHLLWRE